MRDLMGFARSFLGYFLGIGTGLALLRIGADDVTAIVAAVVVGRLMLRLEMAIRRYN